MYIFRADPIFGKRIKEKGTTYKIYSDIWICSKVPDDYLKDINEAIYYDHIPKDHTDFDIFADKYLCGKELFPTYKMPDQYSDIHLCISDGDLYACRVVCAELDKLESEH